jgi:hypothetical protein
MENQTSKLALLDTLRRERAEWELLLAEVGEARMHDPGVMGDWTFKDLLCHLTAWQVPMLARLHWARGAAAPPSPWPPEFNPRRDQDRINAFIHERTRDLPLEAVLREARHTWDHLETGLAALPEAVLLDPQHFAWMNGKPLGPEAVFHSTMHYHNDHEADVRAWLGGKGQ